MSDTGPNSTKVNIVEVESPAPCSPVTLLQIEPTTRCNFTCGFCCGRSMDQADLDFGVFQKSYNSFPGLERMELHGEGEPMLSSRFFDMAKTAADNGVFVSAITNGSMFSPGRIEKLLDSGIQALFVSIESPRADEFRKIRGGSLAKVKRGIRALLAARDARGQSTPSVGFSVTVLKSTQGRLREIADLYLDLGMDGGISAHMLNTMPDYIQYYTQGMDAQTLTPTEQALAWVRYNRMTRDPLFARAQVHFSDLVFGQLYTDDDKQSSPSAAIPDVREYRSCPWLDRALYVNRHGSVSGCARIKNTEKFGFGNVNTDAPESILDRRRQLSDRVSAGQVPAACRGCFIAESIGYRLNSLLDKKPRRLKSSISEDLWHGSKNDAAGWMKYEPESVRTALACCDGDRTGREIIDYIAVRRQTDPDETMRRFLPLLGELVRLDAICCEETIT